MDTSCWKVKVQPHPGSSEHDIATEPSWGVGHEHRVGYRNSSNRLPGLTEDGDYHAEIEQAQLARKELEEEITHGTLINFRHLIEHQPVSPFLRLHIIPELTQLVGLPPQTPRE